MSKGSDAVSHDEAIYNNAASSLYDPQKSLQPSEQAAAAGDARSQASLGFAGISPQNVRHVPKSSLVTTFLDTLPEASTKITAPRLSKHRPLSEMAAQVRESVVLVTVY